LKLVAFKINDEERIGVLKENIVIDLNLAHNLYLSERAEKTRGLDLFPSTILDFLRLGERAKSYASDLVAYAEALREKRSGRVEHRRVVLNISELHILAPIRNPPKIICLGLNYRDHAEEGRVALPEEPILFSKPSTAIVGPDDCVVYPKISSQVDYEIELAVVIGKEGRNISEADASSHIGGYTVLNDISARDIQFKDKQWFRGKSFDTFAPTGPCLVLSDQISDPHRLKIELRVNGEVRQSSTTANMIFKIPQIIAFISRVMTVQPGDIIATGTPAGVGFYAKPEKRLLKPGDIMEAEIEGIGVLRNMVVSSQ